MESRSLGNKGEEKERGNEGKVLGVKNGGAGEDNGLQEVKAR